MGMTIDEVIKKYKNDAEWERIHNNTDYYEEYEQIAEWLEKYQKIEGIVRAYYNDEYADKLDIEVIEMISEVLCDGNDRA
jgi:hypothetical protein